MDYNYESLLDERFQMFCQSLLTRQYPSVQCMPTRMPDGGRDAITVSGDATTVFQVKYARNPAKIEDGGAWVIAALEKELPKLQRLLDAGRVEKYILITNMPSTSHHKVGSFDLVQQYLNTNFPVPSQAWWRDELDRRLDDAFDLKLKYPDLMTGTDAFRLLWEMLGSTEARSRREKAIRAYMSHHYDEDRKVKFKEVGLVSNALFDLFIDVPVTVDRPGDGTKQRIPRGFRETRYRLAMQKARIIKMKEDPSAELEEVREFVDDTLMVHSDLYYRSSTGYRQLNVGAAELLLDPQFAENHPAIILEGAPGQGKSTLSQYLSQVNRARLLDMKKDIASLPRVTANSPLMLPIKLELRDLALWLNGIDPWSKRQADAHNEVATLETAIVSHIRRYSGGINFTVADLVEALEETPALIILDALDEVADMDDRKQVVEEVKSAITRLRQSNSDVRFVITSRPTAIAKSPAFRGENFTRLSLAPINDTLAVDYAQRWAHVKALDDTDTAELLDVLARRMESPHIAELAKNTMQLTILLNLISLRGPSLPDKRTHLYDTYFDVFMDRESEKDVAVRDNREFLIDLHRYLGYYLHAMAEATRTNGRITTEELEGLIRAYLLREGEPADLLPSLTGAVDRIFALVSRVEGMWEFEVQPLQEYFAARYLYNLAPYSPTGRERSGTKPDIFDGIAPNPYWLNVTRFFAGCFSKGELLDLSDRLAGLISVESSYARTLAIALVQDWVFTQSAKGTEIVLNGIFDAAGLRWAANSLSYSRHIIGSPGSVGFSRIKEAQAVVDIAWPGISERPHTTGRAGLCRLATTQNVPDYVMAKWREGLSVRSNRDRLDWLDVGGWLDVIRQLSPHECQNLVRSFDGDSKNTASAIILMARADAPALAREIVEPGFMHCINFMASPTWTYRADGGITWLADPQMWLRAAVASGSRSPHYGIESVYATAQRCGHVMREIEGEFYRKIERLSDLVANVALSVAQKSGDRLDVWSRMVDAFGEMFGQSLLVNELGVMAGSFRASRRRTSRCRELFDHTQPLVDRIRYARSQLNRGDWWSTQEAKMRSEFDCHLWLLAAFAWASPDVLAGLLPAFELHMSRMSIEFRSAVVDACRRATAYSSRARADLAPRYNDALRSLVDIETICIFYNRMGPSVQSELVLGRLGPDGKTRQAGDVLVEFAMAGLVDGTMTQSEVLDWLSKGYLLGAEDDSSTRHLTRKSSRALGVDWASKVLANSWTMPGSILALAQRRMEESRPNPEPVMKIADRQGWFDSRE